MADYREIILHLRITIEKLMTPAPDEDSGGGEYGYYDRKGNP